MDLGYDVTPKPARHLYCNQADPLQQHPADLTKELEVQVMDWMDRQKDGFAANWRNVLSKSEVGL